MKGSNFFYEIINGLQPSKTFIFFNNSIKDIELLSKLGFQENGLCNKQLG
jgi:hypothetical protein